MATKNKRPKNHDLLDYIFDDLLKYAEEKAFRYVDLDKIYGKGKGQKKKK